MTGLSTLGASRAGRRLRQTVGVSSADNKTQQTATPGGAPPAPHRARTLAPALGALGVVFGDIGTSPL
jgi:hypothetical protein